MGWVTRAAGALQTALVKPDLGLTELELLISDFEKKLDKFDQTQETLEVETEGNDEINSVINEAAEFKGRSFPTRVAAEERRKRLIDAKNPPPAAAPAAPQDKDVKLPKLELPKFSGDVTLWQSFWDQFTSHIDSSSMSDISKFSYLSSLLEGDAKKVVMGLPHTSDNYKAACDLLKERYGRKERIIFSHVQALLDGQVNLGSSYGSAKSVTQLWKLRDEILTHV